MNRPLDRRVAMLEAGSEAVLAPAVQAWLGWTLTDTEPEALRAGVSTDRNDIDTSDCSTELRAWLGVS